MTPVNRINPADCHPEAVYIGLIEGERYTVQRVDRFHSPQWIAIQPAQTRVLAPRVRMVDDQQITRLIPLVADPEESA